MLLTSSTVSVSVWDDVAQRARQYLPRRLGGEERKHVSNYTVAPVLWIRIRILLSSSKIVRKPLIPKYWFVTSSWLFIFEKLCKCSSVADPGYLSPIPDPDFIHSGSRILDPGSKNSNKSEGWKKICCQTFFCSHKKKIWASFQRIIELYTQKFVTKL